jgi:hypothetical protein
MRLVRVGNPSDATHSFYGIAASAHLALLAACGIAVGLRTRWIRRELSGLLARLLIECQPAPDEGVTGRLPPPRQLDTVPNARSTTIDTSSRTAGSSLGRRSVFKASEETSIIRETRPCSNCLLRKAKAGTATVL